MRKLILPLLILILVIAYFTKPTDKACIIGGVKAVWGNIVPDEKSVPTMFEEFMDLSATDVEVADLVLFKAIKYTIKNKQQVVAIGVFGQVFPLVKPYKTNEYIPEMTSSTR